jgi:heptosyltransferase III
VLDKLQHIIISRTDAIGDVMLTLPMAGYLKRLKPDLRITFLGNTYTAPVLKTCTAIDEVLVFAELEALSPAAQIQSLKALKADAIIHVFPNPKVARLAKQAHIPYRIGTNRRIFHLNTCNRLVNLSRKNSNNHEAELNLFLLKGIGIQQFPNKNEIADLYQLQVRDKSEAILSFIDQNKVNIILHPKSKGSAREWGVENFSQLIRALNPKIYNILVTGTEAEGQLIRPYLCQPFQHVVDTTGRLSLDQLIALIDSAQILVAASTGPLHIASALGKKAIGLYAPMRPLFPQRWGPLGVDAHALVKQKDCSDCKKRGTCQCILDIHVNEVLAFLK